MLLRSVAPNGVRNSHSDWVLILDEKPATIKMHAASHTYKARRCCGILNDFQCICPMRLFYPTGGSLWRRDFRRRSKHNVASVAVIESGPAHANRHAIVSIDDGKYCEYQGRLRINGHATKTSGELRVVHYCALV